MSEVSILLIGSGGYGKLYVEGLLNQKDAPWRLAGVVSSSGEKSASYTLLCDHHIPVYKTAAAFFKERSAELTIVTSPIHTHYQYTIEALQNGSAVLCEKPVCADMKEFDALLAAEKRAGHFVAAGYQRCFYRDILVFKRDIMAGIFGKPLRFKMLNMPRRGASYYQRNSWAGKIRFNGCPVFDSPLQNACGHELQLMLFLLGTELDSAASIDSSAPFTAKLWKARKEIENFDAAALQTEAGGAQVFFYTAHCVEHSSGPMGEFQFENARALYNQNESITVYFNDGRVTMYAADRGNVHLTKVYDAAAALRGGPPPSCRLKTARPHLECVLRAQEFPVIQLDDKKIKTFTEDDDEFLTVIGIEDAFIEAYTNYTLPELP